METAVINVKHPTEWMLIMVLSRYPETVSAAAKQLDPSLAAKYVYELAKTVSDFYRDVQVLEAKEALRENRLLLVAAARGVLKNALKLLGIETLEEM